MARPSDHNAVIDAYELELAKSTLGIYNAQYTDLNDRWKAIDTKAQGSVAIAGIFIGGIFALARDVTCRTHGGEVALMLAVVGVLALSTLCSALALLTRNVHRPMPEQLQLDKWMFRRKRLKEVRATNSRTAIREAHKISIVYFNDAFEVIQKSICDMQKVVERKAVLLLAGQILMLLAICCGALLLVVTIAYRSIG